ncbi:MAG: GNAT family N-acetyltransferase [Candidatus Sericytochromatia bacterium]|nr:GNAT family N-acetyltransferase [Candidatus Sericytochromatia bacterium]
MTQLIDPTLAREAERPGKLVRLRKEHLESVTAFLAREPLDTVMLLDRLLEDGLPGRLSQEFMGYRAGDEWLGVAYFSGDIVVYAPDARAIAPLAQYALQRIPLVPRVMGRQETVTHFWEVFCQADRPLQFDRVQWLYSLRREDLVGEADPRVRLATLQEATEVACLAAAMSVEEIQLDPMGDFPVAYRRLIEHRIRMQRIWVLEEAGEIRFQLNLNSLTPQAAQLTGVYTPPQHRGKGYAAAGLAACARAVLAQTDALCLLVNDFNTPARRLYEKLGFRQEHAYRAIFMVE